MKNGFELLKKIRERREESKISILEKPAYLNEELSLERNAYFDLNEKSKIIIDAPTLADRHLFLSAMDFINTMQYEKKITLNEKKEK